jgi:hypothetical protein
MGLLADNAEVESLTTSGVLRAKVRSQPVLGGLLITAVVIVGFVAISASGWRHAGLLARIAEIIGAFGAVFAWFQQLSGSAEEIEIGERGIRIDREVFGWNKTSEYPLHQCSDLDLQTNKEDSRRLQFRFGRWRTIEFGDHISEEQATKILDALADSMPEIARKLLPSLDVTKHWTTLNLN